MKMRDLILAHAPRQAMAARLADVSRPNVECFYFGCLESKGHFFHAPWRTRSDAYALEQAAMAAMGGLDTALCWNSPRSDRDRYERRDEAEGLAFRTCRGGWTAVAFWDRSVDRRGACNSAFLVKGEVTFAQVIRAAKHAWPQVWARFTFPVIEVDSRGQEVRHG